MESRSEITAFLFLSLSVQRYISPHDERRDRGKPVSEMLLMMFRSAARDRG